MFAKVFGDRRFLLGTPAWTLALLVAVNIGVARRETALTRAREANLLASSPVVPAGAPGSDNAPRFDVSLGEHLDRYLPAIPDARSNRLVILAGMSQMYAINEPQPGDLTIAEHMDDRLQPYGTRVFGLAAPNLDNEEALILLMASLASPATTPRVFVYALCFDKMRFIDVRPGYVQLIRGNLGLRRLLTDAATRYENKYPAAAASIQATLRAVDEAGKTADSTFEEKLRGRVARYVPLVRARKELNATIVYKGFYETRNKILGISNTSKRPIIQGRYETNKQFLRLMIDEAKRSGVLFVIYINPLNPQADNPYILSEYEGFKAWARATADSAGVPFANLENVVPREDWGLFMGGPDFKHFKGAGHRRTADAVVQAFGPILAGRPVAPASSAP